MARRRPEHVGPPAMRITALGYAVAALAVVFAVLGWFSFSSSAAEAGGPLVATGLGLLALVALDAVSAWRAAPAAVHIRALPGGVAGRPLRFSFEVPALARPVTLSLLNVPHGAPVASVLVATPGCSTAALASAPRGVLPWLVFEARAHGPLGLAAAFRRHRLDGPVPVGPAPLAHDLPWRTSPSPLPTDEASWARGDDLYRSVRDYVRGDPQRSVHWRTSAHRGQLMVREHDALGDRSVRVVVACRTHGYGAEDAMARAAWAVADARRRGWAVQLVTCEPAHDPPPAPPLDRSVGPVAAAAARRPGVRTVDAPVTTADALHRRLAVAVPGEPAPQRGPGFRRPATRRITDGGDTWS